MKGSAISYAPYIGISILVFFMTLWLAKNVSHLVEESWARTASHRSTARFLGRFTFGSILLIGVGISLHISGFDATIFLGAVTFAIGFGLRSWFQNLIAGIIIVTSKIFDIKSFVSTKDGMGSVLEIGAMDSTLKTLTNQTLRIPNALLVSEPITLMGIYPERFMKFPVYASLDADPAVVIATLEAFLATRKEVAAAPESAMILLTDFTQGYLSFEVRYWVQKKDVKNAVAYKMMMLRKLVGALAKAGFDQPYRVSTLNVNVHDSDALHAA